MEQWACHLMYCHMKLFAVFFLILCFCVFLSIAVYKKAELAKKTEVQAHSPSRKIILKPAIKYTRPTHLSCVKRKQTGDCVLFSYAMWLANIDFFFFKSHGCSSFSIFLFFPPRISVVFTNSIAFLVFCIIFLFFFHSWYLFVYLMEAMIMYACHCLDLQVLWL